MKQSVREFPDGLIQDLKGEGLTHQEMIDRYGLTRHAARKVANHHEIRSTNHGKETIQFLERENPKDFLSLKLPVRGEEFVHEEQLREDRDSKQKQTKDANLYLRNLEQQIKNSETPETSYSRPSRSELTAIIHETDPHISAEVTDRHGKTIFDTDRAMDATLKAFDFYIRQINERDVDEVVLLLGGDLVEGEDIFDGQAHQIDQTLEDQIKSSRSVYFESIKRLRNRTELPVKIVCVSGNHGDLGVTSNLNADDLIYSSLEDMIDISDLTDVKFVRSDRSDYTIFNFRDYKGYLTHGENRLNHIGTSSPQSDWLGIKDEFGFDLAFRGHYHTQKIESVNGTPIIMTNSRKPGDDYTDKIATFGKTGNAIYFADDEEPLAEMEIETGVHR